MSLTHSAEAFTDINRGGFVGLQQDDLGLQTDHFWEEGQLVVSERAALLALRLKAGTPGNATPATVRTPMKTVGVALPCLRQAVGSPCGDLRARVQA